MLFKEVNPLPIFSPRNDKENDKQNKHKDRKNAMKSSNSNMKRCVLMQSYILFMCERSKTHVGDVKQSFVGESKKD